MIIYTVKSGDTAFSIAESFSVPTELLIRNNGIENITNTLPVGLNLAITIPKVTHTVSAGETIDSIADLYGISKNTIYRNNLVLQGQALIYPGQELVIEYESTERFDFTVGGYSYTFIDRELLDETLPAIDIIMPFTYGFRTDGSIIPINDEEIIDRAQVYGTAPYFHLSTLDENGVFSNSLANTLLSERGTWDVLAQNILFEMRERGYSGVDIDFEFLLPEDKDLYVEFITYIRTVMNNNGYPLIVAMPPKTSSDQRGLLYEGVDYVGLGQASNYVLIMTYEWGYTYGPPMPVSPTPSIRGVLDYAITQIPKEKIYMGISNYGYDWPLPYEQGVTAAKSLSTVEAFELAAEYNSEIFYDTEYEAPYFFYEQDGIRHEVWFEDARSIQAKLRIINEYGFHGGLYWNFNRENPQNLTVLANTMQYNN